MNKKIIGLVCGLFLCTNLAFAQTSRASAEAFGMSIVQSFFDQNCDFMFDNLDQQITSFEGGQIIQITPELRRLFCSESPLRPDMTVTFQMYEENYQPVLYDMTELNQKFPEWAAHLNLQAGDFFFDGANPIAAGYTRVFTAGDMARFVLRKINGDWKIIAL
jgi:hypothetical protein